MPFIHFNSISHAIKKSTIENRDVLSQNEPQKSTEWKTLPVFSDNTIPIIPRPANSPLFRTPNAIQVKPFI